MRILFWNVRGLGRAYRRGWIKEHILAEDLDIVALQETIKQDFTDSELKELSGNREFAWLWVPARGHSGGILTGVRVDDLELENSHMGSFFLAVLIRNRSSNFRFWVLNIYGPAQHSFSGDFVSEVKDFCANESLPILMGGDFNLIRNNRERNQGRGDPRLMELFNDFIGELHLREIHVSGSKFTWSNKQRNPTMIKLDRILATTCWDAHFSSSFAWSKARVGSDHSPLMLDTGERGSNKAKYFYFQEKWLSSEDFNKRIKDKWSEVKASCANNNYSLHIWHGCLQSLRKYLRGWDLKNRGEQNRQKLVLTKRVEEIDLIAEKRLLSMEEWEERLHLEDKLDEMSRLEDLQWKQKAGKIGCCMGMQIPISFISLLMVGEGKRLLPILILMKGR